MSTVNESEKDDLRAQKEAYINKIHDCEVMIENIQQVDIGLYGDSDGEVSEENKHCEILHLKDKKIDVESLKLMLKMTEEVTSLVIHNYSIDVLESVPENLQYLNKESVRSCHVWKRVEMTCSMDWLPFRLSYVIRESMTDKSKKSYHNLRYKIDRPHSSMELSSAELTTHEGPAALVNLFRQYTELCRQRMEIFHKLKEYENKLFELEKAETGGYFVTGELFRLRWFVKMKFGMLRNHFHLEVDDDDEDFSETASALLKELLAGKSARVELLEDLIKYSHEKAQKMNLT